jgi:hypothetical protein
VNAEFRERVDALSARTSKSPSHVEVFRSTVVQELGKRANGGALSARNLLEAVERYDEVKGSR